MNPGVHDLYCMGAAYSFFAAAAFLPTALPFFFTAFLRADFTFRLRIASMRNVWQPKSCLIFGARPRISEILYGNGA